MKNNKKPPQEAKPIVVDGVNTLSDFHLARRVSTVLTGWFISQPGHLWKQRTSFHYKQTRTQHCCFPPVKTNNAFGLCKQRWCTCLFAYRAQKWDVITSHSGHWRCMWRRMLMEGVNRATVWGECACQIWKITKNVGRNLIQSNLTEPLFLLEYILTFFPSQSHSSNEIIILL